MLGQQIPLIIRDKVRSIRFVIREGEQGVKNVTDERTDEQGVSRSRMLLISSSSSYSGGRYIGGVIFDNQYISPFKIIGGFIHIQIMKVVDLSVIFLFLGFIDKIAGIFELIGLNIVI